MDFKRYFIVKDKMMCFIPRTASTSLLTLIEDKYYPERKRLKKLPIHYRIRTSMDRGKYELVSMIRNPVDRFLSGCGRKGWSVSEGIEKLKKDKIDIHIRPQYTFLSEKNETKLFLFPDEIDKLAEYLDLPTPVPTLNSCNTKPTPTNEELVWLNEYYKKDFELINNL